MLIKNKILKVFRVILVSIGIIKPHPRYVYTKNKRLRFDRKKGVLEPNWSDKDVQKDYSKKIKQFLDMRGGYGGNSSE